MIRKKYDSGHPAPHPSGGKTVQIGYLADLSCLLSGHGRKSVGFLSITNVSALARHPRRRG